MFLPRKTRMISACSKKLCFLFRMGFFWATHGTGGRGGGWGGERGGEKVQTSNDETWQSYTLPKEDSKKL